MQFEQAVHAAGEQGYRVFVESSPHPVLIAAIEETLIDDLQDPHTPLVVPTLGRDDGGLARFWTSAGQAHVCGVDIDWRSVLANTGGKHVELPGYAFQHHRFWPTPASTQAGDVASAGLAGDTTASMSALAQRLHGLPDEEQHRLLVDLVRSQVGVVLGRPDVGDVDAGQGVDHQRSAREHECDQRPREAAAQHVEPVRGRRELHTVGALPARACVTTKAARSASTSSASR